MNGKELAWKSEIKLTLDGRITEKEAAKWFGISERQIRRLIHRYHAKGEAGIVSKSAECRATASLQQSYMRNTSLFYVKTDSEALG
ncbi:MAG: helix-turn-helix domain-containing protein [Anaerolineaceae bacterium]|nr:helix-turn-helix domain-containing protein [Anaerolineaceae bacterium]